MRQERTVLVCYYQSDRAWFQTRLTACACASCLITEKCVGLDIQYRVALLAVGRATLVQAAPRPVARVLGAGRTVITGESGSMGDGTRGTRIWVARCLTAASQPLAEKLGLAQVVPCEGPSPNSEALAAAAAADVLLLIDAPSKSSSMFLPSKLIDYLMFRKPIFGSRPKMARRWTFLLV